MTEEELLDRKYKQQQDALNKQKALEDEKYKRQEEQAAATRQDNQTTLDKNKLTTQGNLTYAGDKAREQGKVLDQFTGFGDGAGIARDRARENVTRTSLTNLETEYGQKSDDIKKNYDSTISDLNFSKGQTEQIYKDQTEEIQNNLKLAREELAFQKAEEANRKYLAAQKAIADENQKLVINKANLVIDYIKRGDENGAYSPERIEKILANALADDKNGFDQSTLEYIRSKTKNMDYLSNGIYDVENREKATKTALIDFDSLNKNRGGAFLTSLDFKNPSKKGQIGLYAGKTYSLADNILSSVENGTINAETASQLFYNYALLNDLDRLEDNGAIGKKKNENIFNRIKSLGIDLTL